MVPPSFPLKQQYYSSYTACLQLAPFKPMAPHHYSLLSRCRQLHWAVGPNTCPDLKATHRHMHTFKDVLKNACIYSLMLFHTLSIIKQRHLQQLLLFLVMPQKSLVARILLYTYSSWQLIRNYTRSTGPQPCPCRLCPRCQQLGNCNCKPANGNKCQSCTVMEQTWFMHRKCIHVWVLFKKGGFHCEAWK